MVMPVVAIVLELESTITNQPSSLAMQILTEQTFSFLSTTTKIIKSSLPLAGKDRNSASLFML